MVAIKLTCSLVKRSLFSRSAPRILSAKQPIVPEMIETTIAENGFATIPKRYAEIPIIAAPAIPAAVPNVDTAPLVPGSTF